MTYHNVSLTGCEDFLHRVPKLLRDHPGWTVERGSIADAVETFISFTNSAVVSHGGDVREYGAVTVFGDLYPDHFEYRGFAFTADATEFVGCEFIAATAVSSYTVVAAFDPTDTTDQWVLEHSDDGAVWTVADTQSNQSFTANQQKTFAVSAGSHLFWRIRGTDPRQFNVIRSLEFLAGGAIVTKTSPEYIFRAQGFGNLADTLIGFHMQHSIARGEFAIRTSSMQTIDPDNRLHDFDGDDFVHTSLRDTPMDMHLNINERRFVAGIHLGGLDAVMYAGAFLPYADPTEYPYPILLAGSTNQLRAVDSTSNTTLTRRSQGSVKMLDAGRAWNDLGVGNIGRSSFTIRWQIYPVGLSGTSSNGGDGVPQRLGPNIFSLFPLILVGTNEGGVFNSRNQNYMNGELEGIAWIPGDGVASGTEFTDNKGDSYRVFQSYGSADPYDHCALRLN